jgi:outer membrane receptor protein involved in Fe transport
MLVCFAAVPLCAAQTLRGIVVDATGSAVSGAQVTVQTSAQSQSATTTRDGSFHFNGVAAPANVTVTAPGFATQSLSWNGGHALTVTLRAAPVQQQVVVSATRTSTPLADVAASVSRLSGSEIAATPTLPLDDALRQVPGFSLFRRSDSRTANPTSQGVSLRGLGASGASRALVLFDGVPLNDPFGGWVYWDRVPSTDISSVEVLRGGGSALYGPGALAGVIDVREPAFRPPAAVVDFSGGQQGTAEGSATASAGIAGWNIGASAQGLKSDGYIPVPESLRGRVDTPAGERFGTGRLNIERHFSDTTVFASGDLFNESRDNGTVLQVNSTRLAEGSAGLDTLAAGGALSLRTYLSGQHYHQTFSSIAADRNSEQLVRDQIVPAQQFGLSAVWNRALGANNTLAIGGDLRRVTGHSAETIFGAAGPTALSNSGGRQMYFGGFLEDMLRLGSRLHVTAATRVDTWRNYDALSMTEPIGKPAVTTPYSDRSSVAFSPSLGAVFQVNSLVSLTASAYGAFRSPTLNELYRPFRLGNVLTLANSGLDAERLRGAEAGVTVGSGPLYLRATYFWNTIHDAIGNRTLSTTPSLITRQRQNLGDILSRGVELELQARLPHGIWTRTAYEYSNSIVSRSLDAALVDLWVPQVPHHAVSEALGFDNRRWSGSIVGRYVGGQFDDDLNQFLLPGFFTADVMLRVRVTSAIEPFVACENLLDRNYVIGRTPTPTLGSPRLLRVGLRFRWGGNESGH